MDRLKRFSHDRDDYSPRMRREKRQRGGGKNFTQEFSQYDENDQEDVKVHEQRDEQ